MSAPAPSSSNKRSRDQAGLPDQTQSLDADEAVLAAAPAPKALEDEEEEIELDDTGIVLAFTPSSTFRRIRWYNPPRYVSKVTGQTERYLDSVVARLLKSWRPDGPKELCDLFIEHDPWLKTSLLEHRDLLETLTQIDLDQERFPRREESIYLYSIVPFDSFSEAISFALSKSFDSTDDDDDDDRGFWTKVIRRMCAWRSDAQLSAFHAKQARSAAIRDWIAFKQQPASARTPLALANFLESRAQWFHACYWGSMITQPHPCLERPPFKGEFEFLLTSMTADEREKASVSTLFFEDATTRERFNAFQSSRHGFFVSDVATHLHYERNVPADVISSLIAGYVSANILPHAVRIRARQE